MTVHNITETTNELNVFRKINTWTHQLNILFNPNISKQAHEVVFPTKNFKISHPSLNFINIPVAEIGSLKHLQISLDKKLNFDEHFHNIQLKVNRIIRVIHSLQNALSRSTLLTIYKSFVSLHLDYGDIIYDKTYNESFKSKLQSIQYNASPAITSTIKGSSKEKLYQKLDL